MNEFYIRNVLEAALLAAGKPLQLAELSQLFDDTARPKTDDLRAALDALATEYSTRGVEVKETAAGFRIQVRREFSTEVSRLWPERPVRYSRALLETLALIAYRQPITRAEIEAVRGVAVNPNIIKTVIERNWVRVVGHRDVPGRPELLGTTREFLDYFGLRTLDELPPLAEVKSLGDYNPQLELSGGATPALEGPAGEALNEGGAADGANIGVAGVAVAGLLTDEGAAALVAASSDLNEVASEEVAPTVDSSDGGGAPQEVAGAEATVFLENATDAVAEQSEPSESRASESDAEAERTLRASEATEPHAASEADDTEASASDDATDPLDALDDSVDEEPDEDELSADGHGSRELVAGPRDLDD